MAVLPRTAQLPVRQPPDRRPLDWVGYGMALLRSKEGASRSLRRSPSWPDRQGRSKLTHCAYNSRHRDEAILDIARAMQIAAATTQDWGCALGKRCIVEVDGVPTPPSPISHAVVGDQCWIGALMNVVAPMR
jgi:hypothetical protein